MEKIIEEPLRHSYYDLSNVKVMKIDDHFSVAPYDARWLFQVQDDKILPIITNSERIRKFLPNINFKDAESAKNTLTNIVKRTELGYGITYFIRENNIPIGMVFVNSPLSNRVHDAMNLNVWSVDFFMWEMYEGRCIMFNSLLRIFNQLKDMGVKRVYALVDISNTQCMRLMKNGLFTEVDNSHFRSREVGGSKPKAFVIDLTISDFYV